MGGRTICDVFTLVGVRRHDSPHTASRMKGHGYTSPRSAGPSEGPLAGVCACLAP